MMFKTEEMTVIMILAMRAVTNESILKPVINFEAITRRRALTTERISPRVKMVAGRVRRIRRGLTRILRIARTSATIKAVVYESILKPGIR